MYLKNIKKLIQISWIVIAICTLILGGILIKEKHEHKTDLNNTKLQNELLLSEKLALEKDIKYFNFRITKLKEKDEHANKLLTDMQKKLNDSETAYSKILRENALTKSLKKKLVEMKKTEEDLFHKNNDLKTQNSFLIARNSGLENSLLPLQSEKEELMKKLDIALAANMLNPDNYLVETHKHLKKDQLTYNAKQIKKLTVVLDLPENHSTGISFNITTPNGKAITENNKMLTWEYINSDTNLTASINSFDGELQAGKQVRLTYTPINKMEPGEYKISVMKNDQNVGNCRVRLK